MSKRMLLTSALAVSVMGAQAHAQAPNTDEAQIEEVIVTAQRRSENLQQVPIAVTVATAGQLQAAAVGGVQALKVIAPSVEVQTNNGYAFPVIRGVGSKASGPGLETPIAMYVDGVYYATPAANLLSFNNIEQIEVLKGPQGTLFGRNATGGLIQITTRDPTAELTGRASVSYGNYDTLSGDFYVAGEVTSFLRTDFAFQGKTMGDGYGTNFFNGKDVHKIYHDVALRSKSLVDLGEATEARLILDYADTENSMNATRLVAGESAVAPFGPAYGGSPWDIEDDEQPLVTVRTGGASLRLDHDMGGLSLASITAYRLARFTIDAGLDYTRTRGRRFNVLQNDRQFSQEVHLLSNDSERFNWVIGAYYFNARAQYDWSKVFFEGPAALPTVPATIQSSTFSHQDTNSISVFGQATYALTERLKFTAGLRYTDEKRTLGDAYSFNTRTDGSTVTTVPLATKSTTFKEPTWRFALDYDLTDDVLGYVSYNRGFKSGGYNPSGLTLPPFEPEILDAYEIGLKSYLLDRHVRLNGSAFYYDYKNTQLQRVTEAGVAGIYNSNGATIYGVDADLEARIGQHLTVNAAYQYTHGRYEDFPGAVTSKPRAAGGYSVGVSNAEGNVTVLTPTHTFSLSGNYTIPLETGDIQLNGSVYRNSGSFVEPDNLIRQPSYTLVNGSVRWEPDNGWSVTVWGANLTDEVVSNVDGIIAYGAVGQRRASYAPPRTFGVTIATEF